MKITKIVPNIKLWRYLIPALPTSSNMFVEHKLNHVSLKPINPFNDNYESIVIIGNNIIFQLIDVISKFQQCMPMIFHVIHKIFNSGSFILYVRRCNINVWSLLNNLWLATSFCVTFLFPLQYM